MARRTRILLGVVAAVGIAVASCHHGIDRVGGAFTHQPEEAPAGLGGEARRLVEQAFADVAPGELRDYHTHMIGLDTSDSGAWVNPRMFSWAHPVDRAKALVYFSAAGIKGRNDADAQYLERLVRLIRAIDGHGRHHILAFDHYYDRDGAINHAKSEFHTPNEYVFRLAERYPDLFIPTISVHPYRPDALEELEKWARKGARIVKWLPNAQGIDAADPRNDAFYRLMKKYDMILLTHVGEEQAVEAAEDQALGNPLRFRRPLDLGIRVIMAHLASLGENEDLDNPGHTATSFDLFLRLMGDKRHDGLLFGEISAITMFNRLGKPLLTIMERKDLHHRLVNASDYPVPAVNFVIHTRDFVNLGMITETERAALNEIYGYNPLLFDYVLKRTIRHPKTGDRLPAHIFTGHPELAS
ncbi:MAG: amidohydrolase family protein [Sphingomonadales bacterium]